MTRNAQVSSLAPLALASHVSMSQYDVYVLCMCMKELVGSETGQSARKTPRQAHEKVGAVCGGGVKGVAMMKI